MAYRLTSADTRWFWRPRTFAILWSDGRSRGASRLRVLRHALSYALASA